MLEGLQQVSEGKWQITDSSVIKAVSQDSGTSYIFETLRGKAIISVCNTPYLGNYTSVLGPSVRLGDVDAGGCVYQQGLGSHCVQSFW